MLPQVPLAPCFVCFVNGAYEMHSWHGLHWFSWAIPAHPLPGAGCSPQCLCWLLLLCAPPDPAVPLVLPSLEIESVTFYWSLHPVPFSSCHWTFCNRAVPVSWPGQFTEGASALQSLSSLQPEPANQGNQCWVLGTHLLSLPLWEGLTGVHCDSDANSLEQ